MRIRPSLLAALLVFHGHAAVANTSTTAQSFIPNEKMSCHSTIHYIEQTMSIPPQLLESIALTESGRWDKAEKRLVSWPWAVMAEGKGRYLPTKEMAIAEVRSLQKRGVRNIDVGCMQINLRHHPQAFRSLEEAFDPLTNVSYAASFLNRLKNKHNSWSKAIGYYHSATPFYFTRYQGKVLNQWKRIRQNAGTEYAQAVKDYTRGVSTVGSRPSYAATAPVSSRVRYYVAAAQPSLMERRRTNRLRIISFNAPNTGASRVRVVYPRRF